MKRYCCAISLKGLLRARSEHVELMFRDADTGRPLTAGEVATMAIQLLSAGREVFAGACNNSDPRGYCQGHEAEREESGDRMEGR